MTNPEGPLHDRHRLTLLLFGLATILLVSPATVDAAPAAGARKPTQLRYEGTVWLKGHYPRPGETRLYKSEATYSADGRGRARLDWITWTEGDTARTPESFLVVRDSAFHRDSPGATWELLAGDRRRVARLQAAAGIPSELGRLARSETKGVRSEYMFDGQGFLYMEHIAHPRLGDVTDSVTYAYGTDPNVPQEILVVVHELHHEWRMTQRPVGTPKETVPDSLLRSPATFEPPPAGVDSLLGEAKLVPLGPGLWSVDMEDIDSRSMIAEFDGYLAVIEIALSSANGERLARAARRVSPKPIRYAFFSHHHPHYLGGLRAMIAEGATVVTTPGNKALVQDIATLPFLTEPDSLARSYRPVKVQTFQDRYELADSTNQLIALNYGDRSQHTDEFVVFYFPRAKLLFESELGWVRVDGKLRAARRAATLLPWIAEQKLDVERIVQSWPMLDNDAEVSRAKLEELVAAKKR